MPVAIAVGANLAGPFGSPWQACRRAVADVAGASGLSLAGVSAWYDTEPVPKSMQPNFINGVALYVVSNPPPDPAVLLGLLHEIEARGGRRRSEPNAARTLDLDLLLVGDLVRAAPDPVLPHPRLHTRRFVLEPLCDVLPGWRHPVLGLTAASLLARISSGATSRLARTGGD